MKHKSKLDAIRAAITTEDYKKAFSIARGFFFGLTNDERRSIEIAADACNGQGNFYTSIGVDVAQMINDAKNVIDKKFGGIAAS